MKRTPPSKNGNCGQPCGCDHPFGCCKKNNTRTYLGVQTLPKRNTKSCGYELDDFVVENDDNIFEKYEEEKKEDSEEEDEAADSKKGIGDDLEDLVFEAAIKRSKLDTKTGTTFSATENSEEEEEEEYIK